MSNIVFVGTVVPEKHLVKQYKFKYLPDKEMREKMIQDLIAHSKTVISEDMTVEINVEISIKEHHINKPDKEFWYENQQNAPKNT